MSAATIVAIAVIVAIAEAEGETMVAEVGATEVVEDIAVDPRHHTATDAAADIPGHDLDPDPTLLVSNALVLEVKTEWLVEGVSLKSMIKKP